MRHEWELQVEIRQRISDIRHLNNCDFAQRLEELLWIYTKSVERDRSEREIKR